MVGYLKESLTDGYDLTLIVLSEPYYVAISEALDDIPPKITVVAVASNGSKKYLGNAYWAPATEEVRSELGSNNFRLRRELLEVASENMDESELAKFPRTRNYRRVRSCASERGLRVGPHQFARLKVTMNPFVTTLSSRVHETRVTRRIPRTGTTGRA